MFRVSTPSPQLRNLAPKLRAPFHPQEPLSPVPRESQHDIHGGNISYEWMIGDDLICWLQNS